MPWTVLSGSTWVSESVAAPSFLVFESGPLRPMALSPDRSRLYAVNTPAGQFEVFQVDGAGLTPIRSIPVGQEPVAVAVRSPTEVWVVNHLSDSVSIVNPVTGVVTRTLLVGDEPRDIFFAGAENACPSSLLPTAANTARTPRSPSPLPSRAPATRSSRPRASAARTSGSSTRRTSARRSAAGRFAS